MKRSLMVVALLAMVCGVARAEEEKKPAAPATPAAPVAPATPAADATPVRVDVTKKEQIDAALDKQVVIVGTVKSAKWTATGKTLQVKFENGPDDFRVMASGKNREALDKAFGGDVAAALTGKAVEISGTLKKYAGKIETWKKYSEVAVSDPAQIKVMDAAKGAEEKKPEEKK